MRIFLLLFTSHSTWMPRPSRTCTCYHQRSRPGCWNNCAHFESTVHLIDINHVKFLIERRWIKYYYYDTLFCVCFFWFFFETNIETNFFWVPGESKLIAYISGLSWCFTHFNSGSYSFICKLLVRLRWHIIIFKQKSLNRQIMKFWIRPTITSEYQSKFKLKDEI